MTRPETTDTGLSHAPEQADPQQATPGERERRGGRHEARRAWSARRKARFARTVVIGSIVLLGGSVGGHALLDRLGSPQTPVVPVTSTPAGPAAALATTAAGATPSATGTQTAAGDAEEVDSTTPGKYGPIDTAIPSKGTGTFTVLPVPTSSTASGAGSHHQIRYTVEVEGGLSAIDATAYAATVQKVLADARGWQAQDKLTFVPVSPSGAAAGAAVDIRVTLATPDTVDAQCAPLRTYGAVSCWNGSRAVLNAMRWQTGAYTFGHDLATYRIYQINHEVGHGLGHKHRQCSAAGQPANIMVQQTKDLEGCTAWPWPTAKA